MIVQAFASSNPILPEPHMRLLGYSICHRDPKLVKGPRVSYLAAVEVASVPPMQLDGLSTLKIYHINIQCYLSSPPNLLYF